MSTMNTTADDTVALSAWTLGAHGPAVAEATANSHRSQQPGQARASSVTSGEGTPIRAPKTPSNRQSPTGPMVARPERHSLAGQLLRHSLVTPEKRTLKRIDAMRQSIARGVDDTGVAIDADSVGARVYDHLRQDRGLTGAVSADGFITLAGLLLDRAGLAQTAATVIGDFLRSAGGIERGRATPERVKAALAALNDALYDLDAPTAPIPSLVRDLQIEKRDGGLQVVAMVRVHADDAAALDALKLELRRAGYGDIDVRVERQAPPASTVRASR
jgi:hypothetical protein